jgi:LPS-assembly protein
MRRRLRRAALPGIAIAVLAAMAARAQFAGLSAGGGPPVSRDQPVFYQADSAQYDRDAGIVTLTGHVEIWQGDRVLRADKVTYDRTTGVAAATGHVALLEPDGQVLFSNYAELSGGMKEGVLRDLTAQLAENGKLAANGGRRTNGQINELSRAVYTTCNLCKKHPNEPPLWELRARSAVQDTVDKRIEYRDAVLDIYGVPVAYFPYFTHADPSVKRQSGFLVPSLGQSSALGAYFALPYFWAIDPQQDLTITPEVAADEGPALNLLYRRRFNNGTVKLDGSIAYDQKSLQGAVFANGQFAWNDEWRYGFDINRASNSTYLSDFKLNGGIADLLTSQVYLEGFGQGAYSRLDMRAYQGLSSRYVAAELPYVLPRYEYSFVGEPDALGGRLSVDAGAFNVVRDEGTNTKRASLQLNWERPATGELGELYKLILHVDSAAYDARSLNQQPSWGSVDTADTAQAMQDLALQMRWPFWRDAGSWGNQVIEPEVQLIASPYGSSYAVRRSSNGTTYVNSLVPNEDSLGLEFTDANLFSLNRFPGIDRLEGGPRAAAALRASWYFPNGAVVDGEVGQSYRVRKDNAFPIGSGLEDTISDVVSRLTFTPNKYLDFTGRMRFDHRNWDIRFADAIASAGPSWLRINGGYIFEAVNPIDYYDVPPTGTFPGPPRNEAALGVSTSYGHYRLSASARRDLQQGKMVYAGVSGAYEDECFELSGNFFRRYTSLNGDSGDTTFLFQLTFKTVGTFGFHAF